MFLYSHQVQRSVQQHHKASNINKIQNVSPIELSKINTVLFCRVAPTEHDCCVDPQVNFDIPISGMKAAGIYGHVFGNMGNTVLLSGIGRSLKHSWADATSNQKASVGIGLVWPLASWGTLEVNYVLPLKPAAYDRVRAGFELGFGTKIFTSE